MGGLIVDDKRPRPRITLPFCYLCGETFGQSENRTKDHVPPRAVFGRDDLQSWPLILDAHERCNTHQSSLDQRTGQLLAPLTGRPLAGSPQLITLHDFECGDEIAGFGLVEGPDFVASIWRWVRGFHAALYREFLPASTHKAICTPFTEADFTGSTPTPRPPILDYVVTTRYLARHHRLGSTDRVFCYNKKCRYLCVWSHTSLGRPMCVFSLRLYAWSRLGRTAITQSRPCVGYYLANSDRAPSAASTDGTL